MRAALTLFASLASVSFAIPSAFLNTASLIGRNNAQPSFSSLPQCCNVSSLAVPLPSNQTALTAMGQTEIVTLGRGIQNYTCTNGAYVSNGALAHLYDISCLIDATDSIVNISNLLNVLPGVAVSVLPYPATYGLPVKLNHLFVTTPSNSSTTSPLFVEPNDPSQRVLGAKAGSLNAPNNMRDVAWLQLSAVAGQGTLAKTVYRLFTAGGQPPSSCNSSGSTLSVQYSAIYWFTN